MMTPKANQIIGGQYEIVKQLGEGTFGITYQARDTRSQNDLCVIKQLKCPIQSSSQGKKERELFEREAKALHKIKNHRSSYLPQFYAHFSENGETYIVQEFIEGHNLRQEFHEQERLSEKAVIKLLKDGLEGLKFLHEQGFIHRDIKPENLMRRTSDYSIVIIDLGAVKDKKESSEVTPSQTIIGTVGYHPPEQDKGILIDSTDIYALGITAIEALTGQPASEIKNLKGEVQWPDDLTINPKLQTLLERMVEDDYEQRYYGTANHALNDLAKLSIVSPSTSVTSSQTTAQSTSLTIIQNTELLGKKQLLLVMLLVMGIASFLGFIFARQFIPEVPQSTPTPTSIPTNPSLKLTALSSFSTSSPITALAVTEDEKIVILGHDNGKVTIWEIDTQREIKEFSVKSEKVTALTINDDGSYLAVGDKTGKIQVWNLADLQNPSKRYELNHQDEITALTINPQGNILVSGGLVNEHQTIKVWELQEDKGEIIQTPSVSQGISSLDINQDGSVIVGGDYQGSIIMWKPDKLGQQNYQYLPDSRMIEKGPNQMYVSLDSDGETMISSFCNQNLVFMQNIKTNPIKQELISNDDVCLVTMNAKGDLAAGLSLQGNLIIWDSLQQKEIEKISLVSSIQQPIKTRLITFSNDGKTLIVVINSEVKTWRITG